jgi:hypothetical protein
MHLNAKIPGALLLVVVLLTGSALAADPATPAEVKAPPTVAELETQLKDVALKGKCNNALVDAFYLMADARLAESVRSSEAGSDEFLTWLRGNRTLHRALLVAIHPKYDKNIVIALAQLHAKFPKDVDKYSHLSLAFALVHGGAAGKPVRGGWARRHKDKSAVPSMADSFEFYVKNSRRLHYPLDKLPWPLLVLVADNDLPLAERKWALARYGKSKSYGKIYYDVPYDMAGLSKASGQSGLKINKHPYTLPNILAHGGVCADRAYYAGRVLKSLGVPAATDTGAGARGGHAWVVWIAVKGKKFAMTDSGRFDFDKYYTGKVWNPVARQRMLDRLVELLAAGMSKSYDGYIDSLVAAHVYRLFDAGDEQAKVADVLTDAIGKRNHYCAELWQLLGKAVADGTLSTRKGESLYGTMAKPYARYPDLTFSFLQDILKPRLSPAEAVKSPEVKKNVGLLDKAFSLYNKAQRPDLAVKLRLLQGRYLEATGHKDKALKLYIVASQQYVAAHFGFIPLFDRALTMLDGPASAKRRLKYLDFMANTVPKYQSNFNRQARSVNPAYTHVVKAYVGSLKESGKDADAEKWAATLPKKK